jgi:DNA-binding IclR family transcriptional regulator
VIAGLSVSAPAERMQDDWVQDVLATARQISARLGHHDATSLPPAAAN